MVTQARFVMTQHALKFDDQPSPGDASRAREGSSVLKFEPPDRSGWQVHSWRQAQDKGIVYVLWESLS